MAGASVAAFSPLSSLPLTDLAAIGDLASATTTGGAVEEVDIERFSLGGPWRRSVHCERRTSERSSMIRSLTHCWLIRGSAAAARAADDFLFRTLCYL